MARDNWNSPLEGKPTRPPLTQQQLDALSLLDIDDMPASMLNAQLMGQDLLMPNAQSTVDDMLMLNAQPTGGDMFTSNAQPTEDDMFISNVQPMGEDMLPDLSDSSTDSEAPPVIGKVPRFSQVRANHSQKELETAIEEVDLLNPARNGPLTLGQIGRWANRNITDPARVRRDLDKFCGTQIDNENLNQARVGPATNLHDVVYAKLAQARRDTKTEQASPSPGKVVSETDSTDSSPDMSENDCWKKKWKGNPDYLSQWKAYHESPRCYHKVVDGALVLSPSADVQPDSNPTKPTKVQNPSQYEQHDFKNDWHFYPFRQWPKARQEDFRKWLGELNPSGANVDISHNAFFDGTSCPDGGASMIIMKEKYGICLRHQDDEQTRLHWHETATGYLSNMKIHLEAKMEKAVQETLREVKIRGTLVPSRKAFHPYLMIRPGEFTDVEDLVPLFNWYVKKTVFLPNETPLSKVDINKIIKTCRERNLPFIVAVPDFSTKVLEKRPDDPKILGVAYIRRFNEEPSTGEVRVLVHHECKKLQIGSSLMDMILRICDVKYPPLKQQPYAFKGRPGLAYLDEHYNLKCNLSSLVCSIAFEYSRKKDYEYVLRWIKQKFHFGHVGQLNSGRVKFGHRYVFCLSSQ